MICLILIAWFLSIPFMVCSLSAKQRGTGVITAVMNPWFYSQHHGWRGIGFTGVHVEYYLLLCHLAGAFIQRKLQ